MKTKNNTHDNIKETNSRNNIRSKIAGLATLAFLAYAPNALARNTAQPEQQKKQEIVQAQKVVPTEQKTGNPYNERLSLVSLGAFYTTKKNLGLEFTIEKSISRHAMAGIGVFAIPSASQDITTNFQDDEYTVGGNKLRGKTDLLTKSEQEIYGLVFNALFGDQCKFMVGPKFGLGIQKNQLNHTFRQTVEDATGKLLDEYTCKAGSEHIKQFIYDIGVRAIIRTTDQLYIGFDAGLLGKLRRTTDVSYLNGAIKKTLDLGPGTMIYFGINANF